MGWRIVKQPNGLLARFSEVCDDFTDMDMTVAEAVECCREYVGQADAEKKVASGLADGPTWSSRKNVGDGLDRWREAMETVRRVHGPAVRREREAVGTAPAGEGGG